VLDRRNRAVERSIAQDAETGWKRFGAEVDTATEQRLAAASAEQLETWAERMLSAATLTELLAG